MLASQLLLAIERYTGTVPKFIQPKVKRSKAKRMDSCAYSCFINAKILFSLPLNFSEYLSHFRDEHLPYKNN